MPSTGIFYAENSSIYIVGRAKKADIENLMLVYVSTFSDALIRTKTILDALKPFIKVNNMKLEDLVMCDLYYAYYLTCQKFLNLGYWHTEGKCWKKFTEKKLQYSRKLLTQTFNPSTKTFKIDEWNVAEPSIKNLLLAYNYIIWRAKNKKPIAQKEAKLLALITYTCGQNKLDFSTFDAVLESFSQTGEDKILKSVSKLEEYSIHILGLYDNEMIPVTKIFPLPKFL